MKRGRLGLVALLAGLPSTGWAAEPDLGPSVLDVPVKEHEAEQGILTPIPVSVELPPELGAARVLLHYRIFGSDRWVSLELVQRGDTWSGAIPCLEVSTITGDVQYYVRVHDAEGAVVAYSGTRGAPYRVRIVHDTAFTEQTLHRARCPDPNDCPAGLEGCPSEVVEAIPCKTDRDCEDGMTCGWDRTCEHDERERTRLSLELTQDLGLVETTGACSLASQESRGTLCYRERDGALYYGVPTYTSEPIRPALGPTRVVAGVDRVVGPQATLGLRVGFAFRGEGPTAPGGVGFFPLLLEGRFTRWFGTDPFAPRRLRPFAVLSGGYGMFDLQTRAHVREDPGLGGRQPGNELEQDLEVWKRAGDAYLGLGGGVSWALGGGFALRGEVDAAVVFPFGAVVLTPRAGVEVGLR